MTLLKNLDIIFVLLFTNYSSLLIDTFDFIKAKRPLAGNAGKMKPPYFFDKIFMGKNVLRTLVRTMKISFRLCNKVLHFYELKIDNTGFP